MNSLFSSFLQFISVILIAKFQPSVLFAHTSLVSLQMFLLVMPPGLHVLKWWSWLVVVQVCLPLMGYELANSSHPFLNLTQLIRFSLLFFNRSQREKKTSSCKNLPRILDYLATIKKAMKSWLVIFFVLKIPHNNGHFFMSWDETGVFFYLCVIFGLVVECQKSQQQSLEITS